MEWLLPKEQIASFFFGARQRNYGVKREPVAYIAESLLPVNVLESVNLFFIPTSTSLAR